eukprot:scaffold26426_cov73-Isochrysis_galbana.AAC.1
MDAGGPAAAPPAASTESPPPVGELSQSAAGRQLSLASSMPCPPDADTDDQFLDDVNIMPENSTAHPAQPTADRRARARSPANPAALECRGTGLGKRQKVHHKRVSSPDQPTPSRTSTDCRSSKRPVQPTAGTRPSRRSAKASQPSLPHLSPEELANIDATARFIECLPGPRPAPPKQGARRPATTPPSADAASSAVTPPPVPPVPPH